MIFVRTLCFQKKKNSALLVLCIRMIAAEADSRGRRMTGAKAAVVTSSSSRTNETRARSASLCVHLVDQLLEMSRLQQQFRFFGLFIEGSEICTYVSDHRINTSNIEGTFVSRYLLLTYHVPPLRHLQQAERPFSCPLPVRWARRYHVQYILLRDTGPDVSSSNGFRFWLVSCFTRRTTRCR